MTTNTLTSQTDGQLPIPVAHQLNFGEQVTQASHSSAFLLPNFASSDYHATAGREITYVAVQFSLHTLTHSATVGPLLQLWTAGNI